jgi:hypothetical protein
MHWNIEITIIEVLVSKPCFNCFIVLLQGTSYQCFPKLFHMLKRFVAHVALVFCISSSSHISHIWIRKTCFSVSRTCFSYNPNKTITYHFMWLFDSKLHETFLEITIDREWCETHERSDINTHLCYQAWAPNIRTLETQNNKVCCICFKEMLQAYSIYTCFTCCTSMSHMFH